VAQFTCRFNAAEDRLMVRWRIVRRVCRRQSALAMLILFHVLCEYLVLVGSWRESF